MKTTYIADTVSLSPARAEFRHHWRFGRAVYAAIVAAGAAVVSISLAALATSSWSPLASAPEVIAFDEGSDTTDALLSLERACTAGDAVSCNDLGVSRLRGYGGPADVHAAVRAFERSCAAGSPDGCGNLGALYESGTGVVTDTARATSLYADACALGGALACSNLGAIYARGRGVDPDLGEARRLFAYACEAGSAAGCYNLLRLTEGGL